MHGDSNDRLGWNRHRQTHHWICAVDADGRALVSVKVANIEADIVAALATVSDLAEQVVWAVDIVGAPSALILALLARAGSRVFYASGRVVNTMSAEPVKFSV